MSLFEQTCSGRTFVVTGVASGIGATLAAEIEANGGRVIGIDRNEPAEPVARFIACDLADRHQIDRAASAIDEPVQALVNVAGVPGSAGLETIAAVNFLAVRRLTQALLPRIADRGAVVNVASAAGNNWRQRLEQAKLVLMLEDWDAALVEFRSSVQDGTQAYDFSKELVILFSALTASAQFHRGVRVNSVSPGAVTTPILDEFYQTMGAPLLDRLKDQAGGRDAAPGDIVGPILFLLGENAGWINGTDLLVDGGGEVTMTFENLARPPRPSTPRG